MASSQLDAIRQLAMHYVSGHPLLLALAILTTVIILLYRKTRTICHPRGLPRLGEDEGISWPDMRKKFQTNCMEVYDEAYQKVR